MKHADLLTLLMPPGSYAPDAPTLALQLGADGQALDAALQSGDNIAGAITPFYAGTLVPDWERVLGIQPAAGASAPERVAACIAKLAATGGLSIPYFARLAQQLGYTVQIQELDCARAGTSHAGDLAYIEDVRWCWQVNVSGSPLLMYRAAAGTAAAGDLLMSFGDPILEQTINQLAPAFSFVTFTYSGT
ncbi:YmfQ family protein [Chromobacterium vaccinii]|uniref:YmfQ family protein n=1 Tax=Chromobacterium vaccinii TaxID=1108595 RepID=UPI003C73DB75